MLCFVAYGESSAAFAHTLLAALLVDLHGVPAVVLHGLYRRVALRAAGVGDGAGHVEADAVITRMEGESQCVKQKCQDARCPR